MEVRCRCLGNGTKLLGESDDSPRRVPPPADKPIPDRFSRRFADVAALAKYPGINRAINRHDIRDRVVKWKSQFFGSAWANYEAAKPGTADAAFRTLTRLRHDYQAMHDMYLTEPATFDQILATLAELKNRINAGT